MALHVLVRVLSAARSLSPLWAQCAQSLPSRRTDKLLEVKISAFESPQLFGATKAEFRLSLGNDQEQTVHVLDGLDVPEVVLGVVDADDVYHYICQRLKLEGETGVVVLHEPGCRVNWNVHGLRRLQWAARLAGVATVLGRRGVGSVAALFHRPQVLHRQEFVLLPGFQNIRTVFGDGPGQA